MTDAKSCEHKNTQIWEPHLAGARKCKDCGMVYNPNRAYVNKDPWYFEGLSTEEQLKLAVEALETLKYRVGQLSVGYSAEEYMARKSYGADTSFMIDEALSKIRGARG